ncbi:MAG: hypothetical protein AAF362_12410 [Pseudomonadota bacterium]
MTRKIYAGIAILMLVALIVFDVQATPPNPYAAPPALSLGSGLTQSGGFCGALPD